MPWIKFYPRDWLAESSLKALDYEHKGLWMDLICLMACSDDYGHLVNNGSPLDARTIARITGGTTERVEQLVKDLEDGGVLSRRADGAIYSRRMVQDKVLHDRRAGAAHKRWDTSGVNNNAKEENPEPRTQNPHFACTLAYANGDANAYAKPLHKTPTLDDCKAAAAAIGMADNDIEDFYAHYASQGWVKGNGMRITNLRAALTTWKRRAQSKVNNSGGVVNKSPRQVEVVNVQFEAC